MNGYAELLIAVYLTVVLVNNKEKELSKEILVEGSFIKWAVALGLIIVVTNQFGKAGEQFMTLVWVALLMTAVNKNPQLFDAVTNYLKA